jgi:hypothetical protein
MNKNLQMFIYIMITIFIGVVFFFGKQSLTRVVDLEEQVKSLQVDLKELRGALEVLKNFKKTIGAEEAPAFPSVGLKNAKEILPIEGFYCDQQGNFTAALELRSDYTLSFWKITEENLKNFSKSNSPSATGSYFIKGTYIYATIKVDGANQNRKLAILQVDERGYARQIEGAGFFFTNESCSKEIQAAY